MGTLIDHTVVVVGINFAPEHTGIAPYTTQACEYLAAQGADVQVLTGVPHYPHWTVEDRYKRSLRTNERHGEVSVRRLRHFVPSTQHVLSRGSYEVTFGMQVATQRLPSSPDVVIAVVPSLLGAVSAARLARRHGARLVIWIQDIMGNATAQSGILGGRAITDVTHTVERRLLRRADAVVVINEAFRMHVLAQGCAPSKVAVIRNWSHVSPPKAERADVRRRLGWGRREIVALHSGNMGLKQGLENVINAAQLAASRSAGVRFVLMGDGNQRQDLERRGAGITALDLLPPADNTDFMDVLAAADVLLVNERAEAVEMSLPSKLTSYFAAGVPVLAAVPADGGTATEVLRSGAGFVVPPMDAPALLDGVIRLNQAAMANMPFAIRAREYLERHLTPSASLERLASLVQSLADGATGVSSQTTA